MRCNFTHRFLYLTLAGALLCGVGVAQDQTQPSDASSPTQPQSAPADQQPARVPGTTPSQQLQNQQTPRPSMQDQTSQPSQPSADTSSQAPAPPTQTTATTGAQNIRIAPGSVIPVELTKTVDAKKVKNGDEVVVKVTQDLKSNSTGEVIVPKDTKVIGHVTEAQARNKDQKSSEVAIAFDHAVMKDGGQVQLPMSIQAIIAPPRNNSNNSGSAGSPDGQVQGNANPNPGGSGANARPGGSTQTSNTSPTPAGSGPTEKQSSSTQALPPITANTQGVLGIDGDLRLSAATNTGQGTVVSSEKTNVKIPDGAMMLLRVNQ